MKKICFRFYCFYNKENITNFDDYTNGNKTKHNSKWPHIPVQEKNAFLNLINNQPDIDKIYLYAKDPYEAKYQYLINKQESAGLKHFNNPKAFIEYSNDVYKNIEEYNLGK